MSEIIEIVAREILDSRGNPTVEVDVITASGIIGRAGVPSGASTGAYEAHELRDGDKSRYHGKGVRQAIENIDEKITGQLIGVDVTDQEFIDRQLIALDGSDNKKVLGANAILGVSLACAKAAAEECGQPLYRYIGGTRACKLPVPLMNVLNGGAHADNGLDVQEFMIVPVVDGGFSTSLRAGAEIFQTLKKILSGRKLATAVGDEGGFAPVLKQNEEALSLLTEAITESGYTPGGNVFLALDVAATELFKDGKYQWEGNKITAAELGDVYASWCEKYPLVSIEDAYAEDDWAAWQSLTARLGKKVQLVGDDLFVTNPKRIKEGIEKSAANALLVKVNQIGTLSETYDAVEMAHRNQFRTVMSHRSGETEDTTIADLAVGMGSQQIKTGAPSRGERTAKYNQLLRIEEELGDIAQYWGDSLFK